MGRQLRTLSLAIALATRFSWVHLCPGEQPTAADAVCFLEELRQQGALRRNMLADRGTEWQNAQVQEYCLSMGINLFYTAGTASYSAGTVERRHAVLKQLLEAFRKAHLACEEGEEVERRDVRAVPTGLPGEG